MEKAFEKIYGISERADELTRRGKEWYLYYGLGKDTQGDYAWRKVYDHKPTLDEVKADIIALIDAQTDEKILTGCLFEGNQVWLSTENQFNYKAEYDLAVQTDGSNLPYTVKLGATDNPVYKTFSTIEDFKTFYTKVLAYIKQCYTDGWTEKDNIDWTKFESDE